MTDRLRAVIYTRRLTAPASTVATDRAAAHLIHRPSPGVWSTLAPLSLALAVVTFAILGFTRHEELRLGVPVVLMVIVLAVPICNRLTRGRSFDLAGIVLTGLGLKLVGIAVRFDVIFAGYDGVGDAGVYHIHGTRLARAYRNLDFDASAEQRIPGTGFIRVVTGYLYAAFGSYVAVGFIVFGLFGFVGCWLLYRAFETAMPGASLRRYALLLFLWPSMLFWPSSIGKEAWIILGLGVAAYGGARVLSHRRGGFVIASAGLWAVTMVRPHITVLIFGAFALAYLLRPGGHGSSLGPVTKMIGIVFLFTASGALLTEFEDFFDLDSLDRESIEETIDNTEGKSQQGGSSFEPADPFNPIGYAVGLLTVLIRPFPWEADNLQMLGTSLEGLVLALLCVRFIPRIVGSATRLRRWPYVAMSIAYLFGFAFAFAAIANFGILARQRTQLLPFVFVLVCLPAAGWVTARRRAGSDQPSSTIDSQLTQYRTRLWEKL